MMIAATAFACAAAVAAAERVVVLDPAATTIRFTLGATLHAVHGKIAVDHGQLRLDLKAHTLTGEVVVDGTSADTVARSGPNRLTVPSSSAAAGVKRPP